MTAGLVTLILGYVLSQFYRAFLAVLSPVLMTEIGAGPGDLAMSLGLWYLAFAAMQIPVGRWLDDVGPRKLVTILLAFGGAGGAAVFAMAQGPWGIHIAMILIGIGCSPVLMGSYFIIARTMRPAVFGTVAGIVVAIGSLGNILGATPLVWTIDALGWRPTLWALAAVTLLVAGLVHVFVRDPERAEMPETGAGSLLDVFRVPGIWAIMCLIAVNYIAAASIRGIWAGPFLTEVHGATKETIGWVTLIMGLSMVAGNFAYGAADRFFSSHKRINLIGANLLLLMIYLLATYPSAPLPIITALLAGVGFFGSAYPSLIAHGRAFLPPHLIGRGVTLLNMFSITGSALAQFGSRWVYRIAADTVPPAQTYSTLFWFFTIPLCAGIFGYYFSRDHPKQA